MTTMTRTEHTGDAGDAGEYSRVEWWLSRTALLLYSTKMK